MSEFDLYRASYHEKINKSLAFSGQDIDFFTKTKANYLSQVIQDTFARENRLTCLDVGCGHGDIHKYIKAQIPDIDLTGVDVASEVIDDAIKFNPENRYLSYNGDRLPFEDNSFDVAYTICVMHHVPPEQWRKFLKEIFRVVKPLGLFLVFEHNPYNPGTRYIVNTCPIDENAVLLEKHRLVSLLDQTGFDAVKAKFILFTPFASTFFKKLDKFLYWLPIGAQYFVVGRVPSPEHITDYQRTDSATWSWFNKSLLLKFLRFCIIGSIASLAYAFFAISIYLWTGLPTIVSHVIGFSLAIPISYIGQKRFTFHYRSADTFALYRFLFISIVSFSTSTVAFYIINTVLELHYLFSVFATVCIVPAVSFLVMLFWVFGKTDIPDTDSN